MCTSWLRVVVGVLVCAAVCHGQTESPRFALKDGDRVVVTGNTFAERLARHGYLTALVHAAHPGRDVSVRSIPWEADTVGMQPREVNVPSSFDNLARLEADVVFLFFGMPESFAGEAGLESFEADLREMVTNLREGLFNGESEPRLVLVTPMSHEDLGAPMLTGELLAARNAEVEQYAAVMRGVASEEGVRLVDLTTVSRQLERRHVEPLTTNGVHPSEYGACYLTEEIGRQLGWLTYGSPTAAEIDRAASMRALAWNQYYHEKLRYHPTNTEYVWGRRHEPFGVVNFPPEIAQLDRMIEARSDALQAFDDVPPAALFARAPHGKELWETIPDTKMFEADAWEPAAVEAKGTETSLGNLEILAPEEFKEALTVPDGYVIECFASEVEFPALKNPLAMTFDHRGRLWVLCAETYPHLLPGESPTCALIILEDTDRDGKADVQKTFVNDLYIPTGFAIDRDGVYVGQAPDILFLEDTNRDDVCDRRSVIASGFGMPDSHHTVSAFEWDPMGEILFHEGVFTISGVETPYGLIRTRDAAAWRLDPRTQRLTVMSHCSFANPWGHAFDDFGQSVLADASGGDNFSFSHVITAFDYPTKPRRPGPMLNRGRPTAGCEIVLSRHFPDEVQGSFLVNQSIGFHGTRWDQLERKGSGWGATTMPQDLVSSSDTNFRPVAMEIGPDGALYLCDWCNPIIGHMQYSVRDPRRDHTHGRIWRVRHERRPLLTAPNMDAASVPELLEMLRLPERNTRQLVRRRLQTTDPAAVIPFVIQWMAQLSTDDPLHDRLVLEGLWIHHALGRFDLGLLDRVMGLDDARARAAAVRMIRHWLQEDIVEDSVALPRLERAVTDDDMHVRLEGVIACGFIESAAGLAVAEVAATMEMDDPMQIVLDATVGHLSKYGDASSSVVRRLQARRQPLNVLLAAADDPINAYAILTRNDALVEHRRAALVTLAASEGVSPAEQLKIEMSDAHVSDHSVRAMAPLAFKLSDELCADGGASMGAIAATGSRASDLARAVLLAANAEVDASAEELVRAMALLPSQGAPVEAIDVVRDAVVTGDVDPGDGIEQLLRHDSRLDVMVPWLRSMANVASTRPFDEWDEAHEKSMAALRGIHRMDPSAWDDEYLIAAAPATSIQRGEALYHDEIVGCARCHGDAGQGTDGIPHLNRSPWVLGEPQRAASIVIRGLFGSLTMPDGHRYESAMEPLGAVLSDGQIVDILNYVRQSWDNLAEPVTAADVARAREKSSDPGMWSVDQIAAEYPLSADTLIALPVSLASTGNGPAVTSGSVSVDVTDSAAGAIWTVLLCFPPIVAFAVLLVVLGLKQDA